MALPPKREGSEKSSRSDIFGRYGGKITLNQFKEILSRTPMQTTQREYVKRVIEKFHHPYYSRGITREEFEKGLDEMLRNTRDPIGRHLIEKIRKRFER
jgi:hypothetical protein